MIVEVFFELHINGHYFIKAGLVISKNHYSELMINFVFFEYVQ